MSLFLSKTSLLLVKRTTRQAGGSSLLLIFIYLGSMSNNVGDNLNQQNLLNYAAASIAN